MYASSGYIYAFLCINNRMVFRDFHVFWSIFDRKSNKFEVKLGQIGTHLGQIEGKLGQITVNLGQNRQSWDIEIA